jgi:hypothetical protein
MRTIRPKRATATPVFETGSHYHADTGKQDSSVVSRSSET